MKFDTEAPINVSVCYGVERAGLFPHWMLMLASEGSTRGTWYHTRRGPTHNRAYDVSIEANKRVESRGIASIERIGTISANDVDKVRAAAHRVPAQNCQRYVVALVFELELKGLVEAGQALRLSDQVQLTAAARSYAIENPVDHPFGACAPEKTGEDEDQ